MKKQLDPTQLQSELKKILPTPVAVVGFGIEGQSSLKFLLTQGFHPSEILIFDRNEIQAPAGILSFAGENYLENLSQAQSLIRTAGLHPKYLSHFKGIQKSQVELFFDLYPYPTVGITGTFGKGTTLGLLESICQEAHFPYALGGNYGIPVLDLLLELEGQQVPLLELSSFQTMTLQKSPTVGAILATTVEHLDWHTDVTEYRSAKAQLFRSQKPTDLCIYASLSEGAWEIAQVSPARKIAAGAVSGDYSVQGESLELPFGTIHLADCASKGIHMLHNMSVAAAIAHKLQMDPTAILNGLKKFKGLPLRMEWSAASAKYTYYNDSYATRPEACLAAVNSFKEDTALIMGGSEKFVDFTELCAGLSKASHLKQIVLIGQTATRLKETFAQVNSMIPLLEANTLEEAVQLAEESLNLGGVVLLSPACASFGMFKNYKHRGEVFHQIARERAPRG